MYQMDKNKLSVWHVLIQISVIIGLCHEIHLTVSKLDLGIYKSLDSV